LRRGTFVFAVKNPPLLLKGT